MTLTVDGRDYNMKVDGDQVTVNGTVYHVGVKDAAASSAPRGHGGGNGQDDAG